MTAAQRGLMIFGIIVVVSVIFCGIVPFMIMPANDVAMALPVIQLPGEVLIKDFPVLGTWTNTLTGVVITDILILLIVLALRNPKMIPGRFQSLIELITGYLYDMTKQVIGVANAPKIFPLIASIFLFVLVANWLELVPTVDSVGLAHCAHEGQKGYPINGAEPQLDGDIVALKVDENLDAGETATEADYHACEKKWFGIDEGHGEEDGAAEDGHEGDAATEGDADIENGSDEANAEDSEGVADEAEDSEDAADTEDTEANTEDEESESDEAVVAAAETENHDAEGGSDDGQLAEDDHGEANEDLLVVTPFVRAAATDLNFTLALALISFFAIQFYGIQALGVAYFYKFFNMPALGNAGKNPMGVMDFGVGILEIISELSKIISFAFRLLGNIFAGQVLLFVIPFLVATLLPGAIYGLELFVGLIQAFVFFMLTLVFSKLAMEGHGDHDEEHEHAH